MRQRKTFVARSVYYLEARRLIPSLPNKQHDGPGNLCTGNRAMNHNDSQFYITLEKQVHLDGMHTVFGQVSDGMDVVEKIAAIPVDMEDRPLKEVRIEDTGYISQYGEVLNAAGEKVEGEEKEGEGEGEAKEGEAKEGETKEQDKEELDAQSESKAEEAGGGGSGGTGAAGEGDGG